MSLSVKCIVVGDAYSGKTSIIAKYKNSDVDFDNYNATIGLDYIPIVVFKKDYYEYILNLWDTAGQEKWSKLTRLFYKDAAMAILVFDLSNLESFNNLNFWLSDIKAYSNQYTIVGLLGNKSDLIGKRQVARNLIDNFLDENKDTILFYEECSAKTNSGIEKIFQNMYNHIIERITTKEINLKSMNIYGIKENLDFKSKAPFKENTFDITNNLSYGSVSNMNDTTVKLHNNSFLEESFQRTVKKNNSFFSLEIEKEKTLKDRGCGSRMNGCTNSGCC